MKITKLQLKQIILEELTLVLEAYAGWPASAARGAEMVPPEPPTASASELRRLKHARLKNEIKQFWLDQGAKEWQASIKAGYDPTPNYGPLTHVQLDRARERMQDKIEGGNGEMNPGEPIHFGLEQGDLYGMSRAPG